jgi:two-component system, OmpR family, sensor histidine kinase CreC
MKIGLRILLGYFLIVGLAAWFLLAVFVQEVKPGVRSTLEDALVDSANLLAQMVSQDLKQGRLTQSEVLRVMRSYAASGVSANINGTHKQTLDYRITITDAAGIVLFDSYGKDEGKDYSRWNDVYRTLRGQYGARSTRSQPENDISSVMHVAAPIKDGQRIIGVLTVAKPILSVQSFVERSQRKIMQRGFWLLLLSLLIGIGFVLWLTLTLRRLMSYITAVEAGHKAVLPALGNNELGVLGRALEAMRHQLEGKQYIEELMHTLAHELKSPIAAIQGSAELLSEPMPEAERQRFLDNILQQNARQKQLIDKLLALVRVEKQQHLAAPEQIDVVQWINQVQADFSAKLVSRKLQCLLEIDGAGGQIAGDALLLRQALGNLLDNAIDFAPPGSKITIRARRDSGNLHIEVLDQGSGIPDYARARLFERFYSLPRADGSKSTGLGLPFVQEVMALHQGRVQIMNLEQGGCSASLVLPA